MTVTGWGKESNDAKLTLNNFEIYRASTDTLRKARVPYYDDNECETLGFENIDTKKQICSGGQDNVDSCSGDSGGPLVYRRSPDSSWYQVGVVSFGTVQCGVGIPGIYTRITSYIDWLKQNVV